MAKSPEELRSERAKRIQDAYALKQPDRIPIILSLGYMLARLGDISHAELENNPDKAQELLEEKLGITFDGVTTGEFSDLYTMSRPLRPVWGR